MAKKVDSLSSYIDEVKKVSSSINPLDKCIRYVQLYLKSRDDYHLKHLENILITLAKIVYSENKFTKNDRAKIQKCLDLLGKKTINSKKELKRELEFLKNYLLEKEIMLNECFSEIVFYRGESRKDRDPIPSVFRGKNMERESDYFHQIQTLCPDNLGKLPLLNKLVMMQHYDCPTRLLDITINPLVALYFACQPSKLPCDGHVVVYSTERDEICYPDSDKVVINASLARMEKVRQDSIYELCMKNIKCEAFEQNLDESYENECIELFYHEICKSSQHFLRKIVPFDILKPIFIQPEKDNARIIKQDGAFILSGLSKSSDEAKKKLKFLERTEIIVKESSKKIILDELDLVGINKATLFPEIDKVAEYLKDKYS